MPQLQMIHAGQSTNCPARRVGAEVLPAEIKKRMLGENKRRPGFGTERLE